MHQYDRETHRCKRCDRWQAGYAPKKERKKPLAECQICERKMAVVGEGVLGHHGYQRPGCGFIVGDCYGVNHQPYPKTDALEKWLSFLNSREEIEKNYLLEMNTGLVTELSYVYDEYVGFGERSKRTTVVKKGDASKRVNGFITIPDFEDLLDREVRHTENQIKNIQSERKRVVERIEKAC